MNFRLTLRQIMGCYLALALLMVPLLGLMHGLVHGVSHGWSAATVSAKSLSQVQSQAHRPAPTSLDGLALARLVGEQDAGSTTPAWSEQLFVGHDKAADCLVFDQLCHFQALHALPLQALPTPLPSFVLVTLAGDFIARWAALFQARGPPSSR
jgi:hypothetical protein